VWGFDRGLPVDRYYVERFLSKWASDVRGRVLEVADNEYTRRYGADRVSRSDIITDREGSPKATIVADLANAPHVPSDIFDCIICTQTLQLIFDVQAAIATIYRLLKPGGVLLASVPGISQIARAEMNVRGDYWRFTTASVRRLLEDICNGAQIEVEAYGNVLTAVAFLHGLTAEELNKEELDYCDPNYQAVITFRVVRAAIAP
jgi:SAM-dependent methyltransferase